MANLAERGGELLYVPLPTTAYLPRHSSVMPHGITEEILHGLSRAAQGSRGLVGMSGGVVAAGPSITITNRIEQTIHGNADPVKVREAAKAGAEAGTDSFLRTMRSVGLRIGNA